MQGKITTEIYLPGISKERAVKIDEMTHRAAFRALTRLKEALSGAHVEIIKIKLQYARNYGEFGQDRPQMADFRIVFSPFFREQSALKLQVIVRWKLEGKHCLAYIIDSNGSGGEKERYIRDIALKGIETLDFALCEAVAAGLRDWINCLERSTRWLESRGEELSELSAVTQS